MEMNNSKTVLKVAGIMDFVAGIPYLLLGALGIAGVKAVTQITETTSVLGNIGSALVTGGSAVVIIAGLICVIEGLLAFWAVKDPTKVMPVWYISAISLAMTAVGVVIAMVHGSADTGDMIGLALNGLVFYAANSMKVAVGK